MARGQALEAAAAQTRPRLLTSFVTRKTCSAPCVVMSLYFQGVAKDETAKTGTGREGYTGVSWLVLLS